MDDDLTPRERITRALADGEAQIAALAQQHTRFVEASKDSNADDEHDPEGATIAFEREQVTALLARSRAGRERVLAALGRLDDGTYGVCERCGGAIGAGRLEARPDTTVCIGCAR